MNAPKKAILSATLLFTLLGSASVMAETPTTIEDIGDGFTDPASAGTTTVAFYSDAQLKKFVLAQKHIAALREEYQQRIESADANADSDTSAEDLRDKANLEMASIIEEQGLDVETYNEMATAYNSEPRVRNRIDALMP